MSPTATNTPTSTLLGVIDRLEEVRSDLISEERVEEADSLATTIADLYWQYRELRSSLG